MQSLAALAHYDFCDPNAYAYEQAFLVIRQLGLPMAAIEEQYRRMVFNIIARIVGRLLGKMLRAE